MAKLKIAKELIDIFYPIGSYYETSNTNFNPNVEWCGTWIEDSKGRVTIGLDTSQTEFNSIGKTDGEKYHKLTINEMPRHKHDFRVVRDVANTDSGGQLPKANNAQGNNYGWTDFMYDNSNNAVNYNGNDQYHNNLQPYIVVKRWHRTA